MQRKIKFKFYDKKRKRLMDAIRIDWDKGIVICVYGGQAWVSLIEDGVLLQCVDCKDKYKKEIYEGFFIIEHDHLGETLPLEVYWDTTVSGFRCRRDMYNGPLPESKNMEVIDNVFENPELLQTGDD
jgi:YopX protein